MNVNTLKNSLRALIVMLALTLVAQGVAAETSDDATSGITGDIGVGLSLGLAGVGAGISQAGIGSAAVGMLAEDSTKFGTAIIFTALPESIVILGALPMFI